MRRPRRAAVGEALVAALTRGLNDAGVDVVDIGVCGTEQVYFATFHMELDGGIMVTASHNPPEYNGMKFVREQASPISGDSGLPDIERRARTETIRPWPPSKAPSRTSTPWMRTSTFAGLRGRQPAEAVYNRGQSGQRLRGAVLERLQERLPFDIVTRYAEPDGSFPNGVPNPMLVENRHATAELVRESGADFGVVWDGDFDRCFFFDEKGQFIEGYYVVGMLAEAVLKKQPGAAIVYDPRLVWNTEEIIDRWAADRSCGKRATRF